MLNSATRLAWFTLRMTCVCIVFNLFHFHHSFSSPASQRNSATKPEAFNILFTILCGVQRVYSDVGGLHSFSYFSTKRRRKMQPTIGAQDQAHHQLTALKETQNGPSDLIPLPVLGPCSSAVVLLIIHFPPCFFFKFANRIHHSSMDGIFLWAFTGSCVVICTSSGILAWQLFAVERRIARMPTLGTCIQSQQRIVWPCPHI